MISMTGGQAIVDSLRINGIDTLFCIPGVELDEFFVALYDQRDAFRVIANRHEQGCAYMAMGYARSTGRVGAYAVVPGPGFLNSSAALATAYACNAPVLCITGQVPSQQIRRHAGAHHEITDQLGIERNLTKFAARIAHPALAPEAVEQAFRALRSGRRRPAALEMAPDVMAKIAAVTLRPALPEPAPREPDPEMIAQAAALLGAARNPMILVGGGIFGAEPELREVAETLQAPVVMTRNAKGALSFRHPLALPESGGHRLWAGVDVVLAVGTRMHEVYNHWGVSDNVSVIRIDVDPTELDRNGKPTVELLADAQPALAALANAVGRQSRRRASRQEEMQALKARLELDYAKLSPQLEYIQAIRAELPDDGFLVSEATQIAFAARVAMPFYQPRTFITAGYQGTLGFGFATSLGVKVANPDRQVVSLNGDGGFLFGASELATAVQYGIAVVALVFNDGAYGNVRRAQVEKYGGRVIASELRNPDFLKLADAFGAQGIRAENPQELRRALRRGFDRRSGPTVIEIPLREVPSPWHLIDMPKVR